MNDIQIFKNEEFGEVRTVILDGEIWFVAIDVAKALGYAKASNMAKLVDEQDKKNISSSVLEHQLYKQSYTIGVINESGLYDATFGSKLKNAKKFKRWVTSEVLPSIRKTGTYGQAQLPQTTEGKIALLAQGHIELKEEVDSIKADLESLKMDLPILPIEADDIVRTVKKKGVQLTGGKQANAYRDRSVRTKVYNDLYANLKHQFNVRSYKAITRKDAKKAVEIVESYTLPVFLQKEVDETNKQTS